MNVIDLIKDDHRTVEKLFTKYEENPRGDDAPAIVRKIAEDLTLHSEIEERLLYPEARRAIPDGDTKVRESLEEHAKVKALLEDIESSKGDSADVPDKVAELKKNVEHHVQEEEGGLLPALAQAMGREKLDELGKKMMEEKMRGSGKPHAARPGSERGASSSGSATKQSRARGVSAGGRSGAQKGAGGPRRSPR